MRVLVADPDPRMRQSLQKGLLQTLRSPDVVCASTRGDVMQAVRDYAPDVVILADGEELAVLREIRQISDVPVLLLSDTNLEVTHIEALRAGADDYVLRPVSASLLATRVETVLRRGRNGLHNGPQPVLRLGDLALWLRQHEVKIAATPVRLTPLEFRLLWQLALHAGEVVPSEVLLDQVWGGSHAATGKYLKVFVNRLRSKLVASRYTGSIETWRGVGYRLAIPEPAR